MSIVLISCSAIGWIAFIVAPVDSTKKKVEKHVVVAEDYIDRGLYQLAIAEYDEAILIDPANEELWADKLHTFDLLYKEDPRAYDDYLEHAKNAVMACPKNAEFHLTAAKLYIKDENYKQAYKILSKGVDAGIDDPEVNELRFETKYAFETKYGDYEIYNDWLNGCYEVFEEKDWRYLEEDGDTLNFPHLTLAGPVGEDSVRFVEYNNRYYLVNEEEIIQGFFRIDPQNVGVYSEGLIAIQSSDGKYTYYDSLGDIQFSGAKFDYAGTFYDGTAAVMKDNKWYIIDKEGDQVSDEVYSDIKLNRDFTYNRNGVKALKHSGDVFYSVYVNNKKIGEYDDVGVVTDDELIAVCVNRNWGFIDLKGNYVIEPQYKDARSFSFGLAAVFDGKKWGFIDKDGKLAIDYQFFDVGYFNVEGYCMVLNEYEVTDHSNEDEKKIVYYWNLISLYNF